MFNNSNSLAAEEQQAAQAMTLQAIARRQSVENGPAYRAKGDALASMVISEVRGQGQAMIRYYKYLLQLEAEGRSSFRAALNKHVKDMGAYVPDKDAVMASTKRSAQTRLSEFATISRALDAGLHMEAEWPFHYAVGAAREFLRAAGAGDNRGRPAKSWEAKLKSYLLKNVPPEGWGKLTETVDKIIVEVGEAE